MGKIVKKTLFVTGVLLCVVAVMLTTTILLLKTGPIQRLVQGLVNDMIPGRLTWEECNFSLLKGEFEFSRVLLKGPSDDELASLDHLYLDLSWIALLSGDLRVASLLIERPRVHLNLDETGALNIISAFVAPSPEQEEPEEEPVDAAGDLFPLNIVVGSLRLDQGHFRFTMASPKTEAFLEGIQLSGKANVLKESGNIVLSLAKGGLDSPPIKTGLHALNLDIALKKGQADLKLHTNLASGDLLCEGRVNLKEAFYNGFLAAERDLEALAYDLSLKLKGISLKGLLTRENSVKGLIQSDLHVMGKGISPDTLEAKAVLELNAEKVAFGEVVTPIDLHLEADAGLSRGTAKWERLLARAAQTELRTDGQYHLATQEVAAQIDLQAPDLSGTLSALGVRDVKGSLDLKANVAGAAKQPVADVTLRGNQLGFQDIHLGDILARAGLDASGTLTVSQLALENQGSSLHGEGSIQVLGDSLTVNPDLPLIFEASLHDVELKDFLGKEPARGVLQGNLRLQGSLKALQGSLALEGKDLEVEAARIGDLKASLRLAEGGLFIDQAELKNRDSTLSISGEAHLLDPASLAPLKDPTFHLDIDGKDLLLEDFVGHVKGRLSLLSHLEGRVSQAQGTLQLEGQDMDFGVQKLAGFLLKARLEGEKITLDPLRIEVIRGETIEGSGWVSLDKALQFSLASSGISLDSIDKVKAEEMAKGKVLFDITGSGTMDAPRAKGEIEIRELQVQGKALDDWKIQLELQDQLARISGYLNCAISGSYHLKKRDFSVTAGFDDVELAPFLAMAGQKDLRGILAGTVEASGNVEQMAGIKAEATFSRLDLSVKENDLAHAGEIKVSYRDQGFSILPLTISLMEKGEINIKGHGKFDGPVDIEANGNIPLQVVGLFLEDLADIKGDLLLSATVDGSFSAPDIRAEVTFNQVSLTAPELMQQIHELNGRIVLTPRKVTLDGIKGMLDTGRFALEGTVDLEPGFKPAGALVTLSAQVLPVKVPETMDLLLNVDMELKGTKEKSLLRGDVVVLEGLYYKDINVSLVQGLGKKKREISPQAKETKEPFLRNMAVDISIKRRHPLLIENNLAQLDVNPDLRLTGTLDNPILSGRAKVVSGTINYQKRTFTVTKGVIDFLNPYKIEPTIDIKSEVPLRTWMIYLEASGTPDELKIELTSNPPEEDQDILALIMMGKTTRELIDGEGGTPKSTEQMLVEMIASTFGEDIEKATGLDIFEVETQEEGNQEKSDRIKVTVGKKLSKRVTVKYSMESKEGELNQRAVSEYKLLENVLLSGFQDTTGSFGGELMYRLEFR